MNNDQEMELACDLLSTAYKETHRSSIVKTLSDTKILLKPNACSERIITLPPRKEARQKPLDDLDEGICFFKGIIGSLLCCLLFWVILLAVLFRVID